MFMFIQQYFTSLKLRGTRNQLIKAALSASSKTRKLNRCRITHLTSSLKQMHGWYFKCIKECEHQILTLSSWWMNPLQKLLAGMSYSNRNLNYPEQHCKSAVRIGVPEQIPWIPSTGFFFVLIKCFQNTNTELPVFLRIIFIFPICNNLFVHLSYIWPIMHFLAKNGMVAVAQKMKKKSTTNLIR